MLLVLPRRLRRLRFLRARCRSCSKEHSGVVAHQVGYAGVRDGKQRPPRVMNAKLRSAPGRLFYGWRVAVVLLAKSIAMVLVMALRRKNCVVVLVMAIEINSRLGRLRICIWPKAAVCQAHSPNVICSKWAWTLLHLESAGTHQSALAQQETI